MHSIMVIGAILFGIGFVTAAIGGVNFALRAVMNKPAWGGITTPFLVTGIILVIVGLAAVILTAMANGQFN